MKKILFVFMAFLMTMSLTAMGEDDRVITFDQLPAQSKDLLKKHFAAKVPLVVTVDYDDYKVVYQSGEKVEFDKRGNWKEFECKTSRVPVALIPEQIKSSVKTTFPGATIIKLSRDRRGYEVKLNNGMDLEFNRSFQIVEIDD